METLLCYIIIERKGDFMTAFYICLIAIIMATGFIRVRYVKLSKINKGLILLSKINNNVLNKVLYQHDH